MKRFMKICGITAAGMLVAGGILAGVVTITSGTEETNKLLEKAGWIPLIQPRTRYSYVEKDVITPGESGDTAQFEESEEWPDWSDWDDWSDFKDSSEDIIGGFAEGSGSTGALQIPDESVQAAEGGTDRELLWSVTKTFGAKDIEQLELNISGYDLQWLEADGDEFQIKAQDVEVFEASVKGDALKVDASRKKTVFSPGQSGGKITIYAPEDFSFTKLSMDLGAGKYEFTDLDADKADVKIGTGQLKLSELSSENATVEVGAGSMKCREMDADKLQCTIGAGSGKIEDISGDDVQLNVNAGNLIMREINAEKLNVEVGAGKANAERIQTENAYFSINAGSGRTDILTAENVTVKVGAGSMSLGHFKTEKLTGNVDMGSMQGEGTVTKNMEVECNMGSLSFGLNGNEKDYDYDLSCAMGKLNVGSNSFTGIVKETKINNNAGNKITAKTSMGSVIITFSE